LIFLLKKTNSNRSPPFLTIHHATNTNTNTSFFFFTNFPSPGGASPDLLRRFVTLIDVCYEHGIKVVLGGVSGVADLFGAPARPGKKTTDGKAHQPDVSFASDRTVSRLREMQTIRHLERRVRSSE
jgi:predicted ATPase